MHRAASDVVNSDSGNGRSTAAAATFANRASPVTIYSPRAASMTARYETTSQLPPSAQHHQQQWFASNAVSNNICNHTGTNTNNNSVSDLAQLSRSSSINRRTPTAVLMPATLISAAATTGQLPTVGHAASGHSGANTAFTVATAAVVATAPAATTAPALDALFPVMPPPVPLTNASSAPTTSATQPKTGGGKPQLVQPQSQEPAHLNSFAESNSATPALGMPLALPSSPTTVWPSPSTSPSPGALSTAGCGGGGFLPVALALSEDLVFSPITTSFLATAGTSPSSINASHTQHPHGGGNANNGAQQAVGSVLSSAVMVSPGTSMAGGVSTMSVGVVPPASTWGDVSLGAAGGTGVVLTPAPTPLAAAAGGSYPSLQLGCSLTLPSPTARQTTATVSVADGVGGGSGAAVSGAPRLNWPAKVAPSQPQCTFPTMSLPAAARTGPAADGSFGPNEGSRFSISSFASLDLGKDSGGKTTECRSPAPEVDNVEPPVSCGPPPALATAEEANTPRSSPATHADNSSNNGSSSYRIVTGTGTPTSLPHAAHIVFLPVDVSSTGKLTPPTQHLTPLQVQQPQPQPSPPAASSVASKYCDPMTAWTPLPSTIATATAAVACGSTSVGGIPATPISLTSPESRANSEEWVQLSGNASHPSATTPTAVAARSPRPSNSVAVWTIQQPQQQTAAPVAAAATVTSGSMASMTPPLRHTSQQFMLPRVMGPAQRRVPCTPVQAGVHAECSICLRTTDDIEDAASENENERLLQELMLQQQESGKSATAAWAHSEEPRLEGSRPSTTMDITRSSSPQTPPSSTHTSTSPSAVNRGVKSGSPMVRLSSCGHCFHSNCLQRWLLQEGSCPMCRRSVSDSPTPAAAAAAAIAAAATAAATASLNVVAADSAPFSAPAAVSSPTTSVARDAAECERNS